MINNIDTELTAALRPYHTEVQARLKVQADKVINQYARGLLTFEDLMLQLTSIDDAAIYEQVAADPKF